VRQHCVASVKAPRSRTRPLTPAGRNRPIGNFFTTVRCVLLRPSKPPAFVVLYRDSVIPTPLCVFLFFLPVTFTSPSGLRVFLHALPAARFCDPPDGPELPTFGGSEAGGEVGVFCSRSPAFFIATKGDFFPLTVQVYRFQLLSNPCPSCEIVNFPPLILSPRFVHNPTSCGPPLYRKPIN